MAVQDIKDVEFMNGRTTLILSVKANPSKELNAAIAVTDLKSSLLSIDFGSIAPKLFNLEPIMEPEKMLNIKLDLYQMEQNQTS